MRAYKFFQVLLALILLAGLSVGQEQNTSTDQPNAGPITVNYNGTAIPDHVTLSWVRDPMTTRTVTWRTGITVNKGVVQYSDNPGLRHPLSVTAYVRRLKADLCDENIYNATLIGLRPGTRYYYRVGDGTTKNWSSIYFFDIEKKLNPMTYSLKFLVFGDTQAKDENSPYYSLWDRTVHNAYALNPDARFFTVVGDLAQSSLSNPNWNLWFNAAKGVIDRITFMPVEGNTECKMMNKPKDKEHGEPAIYTGQFNVPKNGPFKNCEAYSYDYGDVHFVVLDSQLRETIKTRPDLLGIQASWLENDLRQTTKKWKVVFWHKPTYPTRAYRTNEGIKANFTSIIDKYHVDVVFNGHDHAYARTYPINNDEIVGSPALGTVYVVTGRSGEKDIPDNERKAWDVDFFSSQDMPNYIVVTVSNSQMNIKAYKMDGTLIDNYIIDKKNGDTSKTVIPSRYNDTQLAVNGDLLNQLLMPETKDPTFPYQINGKWYFPIKPVVEFLGGNESSVSADNENLSLSVKNNESSKIWKKNKIHTVFLTNTSTKAIVDKNKEKPIEITLPDPVMVVRDDDTKVPVFLISADDMHTLFGFTWRYDPNWNVLFLINPGKNGEGV